MTNLDFGFWKQMHSASNYSLDKKMGEKSRCIS